MKRFSLSPTDINLIKRVLIIATIVTAVVIISTWGINSLLFRHQTVKKTLKNNPLYSLEIQPFDIEAHEICADKYMERGMPKKAIDHLTRAYILKKKDPKTMLHLAHALLEAGNYKEALKYYDLLITRYKNDSIAPEVCARRGIALFYTGNITESKSTLETCIQTYPEEAEALCFLGQIEATQHHPSPNAVSYFNKAIAADSSYTEGWYQLARYYMGVNVYPKARELLLTAVATNPFHSKSHARLGMVYYYLDYPVLAKKSYNTALVLNPDDFNTRYNLAELQITVFHDTIDALKQYKKALELNPHHYNSAYKVGILCFLNHMYKEAIQYFEKALSIKPNTVGLLLQYAATWEKLKQYNKAISVYDNILQIDQLNTIARQKKALILQEKTE